MSAGAVDDGGDPLLVLVVAGTAAMGGAGLRLVSALANATEALDVALAVGRAADDEVARLRAGDIDVAVDAPPAWFATNRARASVVVVVGPDAGARFAPALDETQPQTAVVYDMSGPGTDDHVADRRAEVALLRRAQVVLAPSAAAARFAREVAPTAHVVVAAPGTPDLERALAQALAQVGVALPDAAFALPP